MENNIVGGRKAKNEDKFHVFLFERERKRNGAREGSGALKMTLLFSFLPLPGLELHFPCGISHNSDK